MDTTKQKQQAIKAQHPKISKAGKALRANKGKGTFLISANCFADDDVL